MPWLGFYFALMGASPAQGVKRFKRPPEVLPSTAPSNCSPCGLFRSYIELLTTVLSGAPVAQLDRASAF